MHYAFTVPHEVIALRHGHWLWLVGPARHFSRVPSQYRIRDPAVLRPALTLFLDDERHMARLRALHAHSADDGTLLFRLDDHDFLDRVTALAAAGPLAVARVPIRETEVPHGGKAQRIALKGVAAPGKAPGTKVASQPTVAAAVPAQQPAAVGTWSLEECFAEVLRRTPAKLPAEMRDTFVALLSPENLGNLVTIFAAWADLQATGVGEVIDVLVVVGFAFLGWIAFHVRESVRTFLYLTFNAKTSPDLDRAADALAKAIALIGVAAFLLLVARGAKVFKSRGGGGKLEERATSQSGRPEESNSASASKVRTRSRSGAAETDVAAKWGKPNTLAGHYRRHGADFGATSDLDYATQARNFHDMAKSRGLPIKVDEQGTIRVYDAASNTFGAYNSDGSTKTFFKPRNPNYFARQPPKSP